MSSASLTPAAVTPLLLLLPVLLRAQTPATPATTDNNFSITAAAPESSSTQPIQTAPRRLVVAIAASDGGDGRDWLRYAVSDAQAVLSTFVELGGVTQNDAILLMEPSAYGIATTLRLVKQQVQALTLTGQKADLVFYFSGHADEDGLLLGNSRYAFADLKRDLIAVGANTLLGIVDACAAGAIIVQKGGRHTAPFLQPSADSVHGQAFVSSAARNEAAQESARLGASFFTHYFVTALRGAADVDHDQQISLYEAYDFAYHATLAATEKTFAGAQHANYAFELSGTGQMILTTLANAEAVLFIDTPLTGRLSIRDADGRTLAELQPSQATPLRLLLRRHARELWLDTDSGLFFANLDFAHTPMLNLSSLQLKRVAREDSALRGVAPVLSARGRERAQQVYNDKKIDFSKVTWFVEAPVVGPRAIALQDEALYAEINRYDLWRECKNNKQRALNLLLCSGIVVVGGVGMFYIGEYFPQLLPVQNEVVNSSSVLVTGLVTTAIGALSAIVIGVIPYDPLNDAARRQLVDTYNQELRRELGLSAE